MLCTASVALSILRFGEKKADREVFVVLSIVKMSYIQKRLKRRGIIENFEEK